jgi:hypothetical protein
MSVYEMADALDVAKLRITELENVVDTVKISVSNEFREKSTETERTYREEMQRQIQLREQELTAKFEKRIEMNQKTHQDEIENLRIIHAQEVTRLKGE